MKFYHIIFVILFFWVSFVYSEEQTPQRIVDNFFQLYEKRGAPTAVDYLFSNNPVLYQKAESIGQLKKTFRNIKNVLGEYKGHSIINQKEYYRSLQIIITYVKFERQPLRFLFVFYKPDEKWLTYRFEIDTKFPDNMIDSIFKSF